jgi:hypothetical protein
VSDPPARDGDASAARGVPAKGWLILAVCVSTLVGLALYLPASFHAVGGNSDGATVILEGQAVRAGHLLLRGWSLSLDSFWSVDVVFYAAAVTLSGVRSALLNVVPCVIAALLLAACVWLAAERRRIAGALAATLTVFAILALPSRALALVLLAGPLHVGTVLWCVLAFAAAERAGHANRAQRGWWVLGVVLLAAGLLGDLQTLPLGVVPLALAAVVAGARARRWRAALPRLSLPVAAALLALVVRAVAHLFGTYAIAPANPFASGHQIIRNLGHLFTFGAPLLGLGGGPFGPTDLPRAFEALHVLFAAVVLGGPLLALASLLDSLRRVPGLRFRMPTSSLDDVLLFAFLFDIGAFIVLPITNSDAYVRYLTAAVVFGTLLGARAIGTAFGRLAARRVRLVGAAGLLLVACGAAGFGFSLRGGNAGRPAAALGPFLAAHGLNDGIGDYWSSSIVTVESGGAVTIRPVIAHGRVLVPYAKQSASSWYGDHRFAFYVYNSQSVWNGDDRAVAIATFGHPRRTYAVGSYRVLVWPAPVTLASDGWTGP